MASASSVSDKIHLNFAWTGPNRWRGGISGGGLNVRVVDLVFKGAKTDISVHLPENINPMVPQQIPFTCRKYHETTMELAGRQVKPLKQETHPDSLSVTVEQIYNLTVKAGIFEQGRPIGPKVMDFTGKITQQQSVLRSDRAVRLEIPAILELGHAYNLVVSSNHDLSLSARLVKVEEAGPSTQVPHTNPSEISSDLDQLSIAELQAHFEATFTRDKELEVQRVQAAIAGNTPEMERILEHEYRSKQLLLNLAAALQRKGVKPQIPETESFQAASRESERLHAQIFQRLQGECKMQ